MFMSLCDELETALPAIAGGQREIDKGGFDHSFRSKLVP